MSSNPAPDLERAFAEIEACIASGKALTRHHARPVLICLGEQLLAGETASAAQSFRRCRDLTSKAPGTWGSAVRDELLMASTEHVRSVDPRWLDHPTYDFEYTVAARAALEARLRAARDLGFELSPDLEANVARADGILAQHLARRRPR